MSTAHRPSPATSMRMPLVVTHSGKGCTISTNAMTAMAASPGSAAAKGSARPWWRDPGIAATAAVGIAVGAVLVSLLARSERVGLPVEYDVGLPDTAGMETPSQDVGFAVSPGGDFVVYETVRQGRSELWYRSLLDATVRRIPGTDDGSQPAISPDGNRIAFFHLTDGGWTVEVIPVEGGTATTIGRGVGVLRRLLWATGGRILAIESNGAVPRWLDPERGPVSSVRIRYCEDQALIPGRDGLLCGGGASKWGYRVTVQGGRLHELALVGLCDPVSSLLDQIAHDGRRIHLDQLVDDVHGQGPLLVELPE